MKLPSKDLRRRTRRLNKRHLRRDRKYVLCWIQQSLRGYDNPTLDVAIAIGNEQKIPVVVYHGLDNRYPYASHRFHRFLLEASQSLESDLKKRRLRFCRYVRRPAKVEPGLVYGLAEDAACLVTDDVPTFVARSQADRVARKIPLAMFAVDVSCAVPLSLISPKVTTTKGFRATHKPLREPALEAECDLKPEVRKFTGKLCFEHDAIESFSSHRLDRVIKRCEVDMDLPPAAWFPGSRKAAIQRLEYALENIIPRYKWTRNNPALVDSTTRLSPYMHFGVLGSREVARAVQRAELHSAARWKFLDELLTWREYHHHLCRHSKAPASYDRIPNWARESLEIHADDPREKLYSIAELLHGHTEDEVWNVAQRQFLLDGWMHNNLRMYWVKQLIKWLPTPQEAWQVACYLNDRLSLDGRDPATYGGILWGFGLSRRGYREVPIYGWVPKKSDRALRKRAGVEQWLEKQFARETFELSTKGFSKESHRYLSTKGD